MREAEVYRNGLLAGILKEKAEGGFEFRYEDGWMNNKSLPAISLTLPKTKQEYNSSTFFPFFFNMLAEGANRHLQCRHLQIDEEDHFGLLIATAKNDAIGPITVKEKIYDED